MSPHRLSKFEVALLWIKHMEFYLEDDIQFNFVEVFHSSDPLMPDFDEPRYSRIAHYHLQNRGLCLEAYDIYLNFSCVLSSKSQIPEVVCSSANCTISWFTKEMTLFLYARTRMHRNSQTRIL
jgi:hypothetical protein